MMVEYWNRFGLGHDIFLYWNADCIGHEGQGGTYDFVKGSYQLRICTFNIKCK